MSAPASLGNSLGLALALSGAVHAVALAAILTVGPQLGTRPEAAPPQVVEVRFEPAPDATLPPETRRATALAPAEAEAVRTDSLPESQAPPPPLPKSRPPAPPKAHAAPQEPTRPELALDTPTTAPAEESMPARTASASVQPAPAGAIATAGIATAARPAGPRAGNPMPTYPRRARERGIEGRVTLKIEVLADGSAGAVSIAQSSGHQVLDRAAIDAVRTWRFRPAEREGVPLVSSIEIPVAFRLVD